MIFLHGLGADHTRFEPTMKAFSRSHHTIAIDLPGFGRSKLVNSAPTAKYHADTVVALMDELKIDSATIIGNSMGGWIALHLAERHPDRVRSLVLVAPAFVKGVPEGISATQLAKGANPQTMEAMRAYLAKVYAYPPSSPAIVRTMLENSRRANENGGAHEMAETIVSGTETISDARLSRVSTRTLVLQGDQDKIVSVEGSRRLTEAMPNAIIQVIEGSGHWPQIETPAKFERALREFLNEPAVRR